MLLNPFWGFWRRIQVGGGLFEGVAFREILIADYGQVGSFVYCKTLQAGIYPTHARLPPKHNLQPIDANSCWLTAGTIGSATVETTGDKTGGTTSQSSSEWRMSPISSQTADLDQHPQAVDEGLHHLAEGIPNPLMRRTLMSAASNAIQSSRTEMQSMQKNKVFHSKPCVTPFGKVIFRTEVIEHTISLAGESSVQTETRTSFIFHPAPWLLKLGLRYGLKAMAINHHRTWQYNISPVYVRPDDSVIFRFCQLGNTEAVRELFVRGEASVHDINTNGMSLLHVSSANSPIKK